MWAVISSIQSSTENRAKFLFKGAGGKKHRGDIVTRKVRVSSDEVAVVRLDDLAPVFHTEAFIRGPATAIGCSATSF